MAHPRPARARFRHWIAAALLVAALAVNACAPGPDPRPVLRVASQKGGTRSLMLAAHALDGAPYRVEWSEFPSAQTLLEALGAGAVDLGAVGDAPFLFAYANDPRLRIVQVNQTGSDGASVAVVVPDASPLRRPRDLKGRRIATGRGSIGHYLALRLLAREGLQPTDATFVFLSPADAKAALASRSVDAWATWGPYIGLERLHGRGRVLADGRGLMSNYGFEASTVAAMTARRPLIADFLARLARAETWETDHPDVYARVLARETGLPQDVASDTVRQSRPIAVRMTDSVRVAEQATLKTFVQAGLITRSPDLGTAFDTGFSPSAAPSASLRPK